ncbi:glycosyltransferase family 2 protein [Nesterenkonia flava]|uniref:Glycosyltransferase n=1 Tax=Nesterenkonia flava TaxID=469799 RepID=A0ABU1FRT7_9MICC|nr:glycosyltransferase [Nesterenkonia flava]MDR5711338.1 glycosyltransferase [Nesterenkonia flava]
MTEQPPALDASHVYICVATYRRNELLTRLLRSLSTEPIPAQNVIVVDNAPVPAAEATVKRALPLARYLHQPQPGIGTARNTSLDAVPTDAQAVIFLDDDEYVRPGWLAALLDCADSSGAHVVTGPVTPEFTGEEPAWLEEYGYVRRTDRPTGPWLSATGRGGQLRYRRPATNNTLVRAHWFTASGFRFDERFNFSGGEDSELFDRLLAAGADVWWCAQAQVVEVVPQERATKEWLRARAVRGGRVRALKMQAKGTRGGALAVRLAAESAVRIGYGSLRRAQKHLRRRPVTYTDDYYVCEGVGMAQALLGRGADEYARSSRRS